MIEIPLRATAPRPRPAAPAAPARRAQKAASVAPPITVPHPAPAPTQPESDLEEKLLAEFGGDPADASCYSFSVEKVARPGKATNHAYHGRCGKVLGEEYVEAESLTDLIADRWGAGDYVIACYGPTGIGAGKAQRWRTRLSIPGPERKLPVPVEPEADAPASAPRTIDPVIELILKDANARAERAEARAERMEDRIADLVKRPDAIEELSRYKTIMDTMGGGDFRTAVIEAVGDATKGVTDSIVALLHARNGTAAAQPNPASGNGNGHLALTGKQSAMKDTIGVVGASAIVALAAACEEGIPPEDAGAAAYATILTGTKSKLILELLEQQSAEDLLATMRDRFGLDLADGSEPWWVAAITAIADTHAAVSAAQKGAA